MEGIYSIDLLIVSCYTNNVNIAHIGAAMLIIGNQVQILSSPAAVRMERVPNATESNFGKAEQAVRSKPEDLPI